LNAKRLTLGIACAAALVLAAVAVAGRERLLERYYILRLNAADEPGRRHAAERLADFRSVDAVPHLVRRLEAEARETDGEAGLGSPFARAICRIGFAAAPALDAAVSREWQRVAEVRRFPEKHSRRDFDTRFLQVLYEIRRAWESPARVAARKPGPSSSPAGRSAGQAGAW
jgi:hypothetical protein